MTMIASPVLPLAMQMVRPPNEVLTAADFNSWLGTVASGTVINLTGLNVDATEGPICLVDRSDLTFLGGTFTQSNDGSSVTSKSWAPGLASVWPRNRAFFYCVRSSRIQWIDTTVVGTNTVGEYKGQSFEEQAGFALRHCSDVTITSPKVQSIFGDVVSVVHEDANRLPCERVAVVDVDAEFLGRNLVSVVSCIDFDLHGAKVWKTARSCFNIEPAVESNICRRIRARNVSASAVGGVLVGNLGGSNNVSDIILTDMRLTDKPVSITMQGRTDRPGRRSNYTLERISGNGKGVANGVCVNITNIDNVAIRDVWQRVAGYLADSTGKVIYPGIGMKANSVNSLILERVEFPKGSTAKTTGDVTPWVFTNCTDVQITY